MRNASSPFSQRVRRVRLQIGMSQEQLAAELGVSFATVNRWENGHTNPSHLALKQFEQLCNARHIETSNGKTRTDRGQST
jgi:transcriptional regulator with XRE-family HTH domain